MAGTTPVVEAAPPVTGRRSATRRRRGAAGSSRYEAHVARLAPKIKALREMLGSEANVIWWPEMSARERATWERQVKGREKRGEVDWVVAELRKIRAGRS